jgi:DNA-binding GntR family transcriptional regulator
MADKQGAPGKAVSLMERAYKELEEMIVTLQLEPGAVLSEATLAAQLGIGRTPIREALHRLAREGLVVILPRRGILVSEINIRSQLKLLEVRREIERLMSRSAAARASDAERLEFRNIAGAMITAAEIDDDVTFMRQDLRFNQLLALACRNSYATNTMSLMASLVRRFWFMHHKQVADMPMAARRHADVAVAIADGDGEEAAVASDRLVDYAESCTRAALDT